MTLSPEDSVLIEKVARFALYHRNLPAKNFNFPRNLAPILEKWIIDKHPFRLDGLVLLGFCIVAHSNVKILLKQVQEASEKITAELKLLLLRSEICTEIGELSNWNFKDIQSTKFTASKDQITIADASSSDFWFSGLGASSVSEFDDLEPPDDEILEQMSICNDGEEMIEEPEYGALNIDTNLYLEVDNEDDFPKMGQASSTLSSDSFSFPDTFESIHIDCLDGSESCVDTVPSTALTPATIADFHHDSTAPSPIVSPNFLSPVPFSSPHSPPIDLDVPFPEEFVPCNFTPCATSTPKKNQKEEKNGIPKKKRRLNGTNQLPDVSNDIENLIRITLSEKEKALKILRDEIATRAKKVPRLANESPIEKFLKSIEAEKRVVEEPEPSTSFADSGFLDGSAEAVDDVEYEIFDSLSNSQELEEPADEELNTCEKIKYEMLKRVENADTEPIPFSLICPSASRKSAARAFFSILEITKSRKIAPPMQLEPYGEIYLSKNNF